jgi:hypothetical protein
MTPRWPDKQLKVRHKFHAKPVERDGIRFDSKLEARYYDQLKLRQAGGDVVGFLRQVPVHLPGGVVLRFDFLEFRADGTAIFVDTKGVETESFRAKIRQVRALYPWLDYEIVKKVR